MAKHESYTVFLAPKFLVIQARSEGGSTGSIEPPPSAASSTCIHVTVRGRSCKLPNISVKIQLNLHQNEPFQVKKSQNFLGRGHSPSPEPSQLVPGTATVRRHHQGLGP